MELVGNEALMPSFKLGPILALGLAVSSAAFGQSLGDLARHQRQKQTEKPANATHKVITDEDMPSTSTVSKDTPDSSKAPAPGDSAPPINSSSNAEQVKAAFVSAKQQVKDFQAQLDELRASIHYVEANRYSNGPEYNQYQLRKQKEADRMQHQLEAAQKKLQDMQEAARKAGFGSAVYDP
jgi:hypothetical protein